MKNQSGDFEMSILVGHKPIHEYFHEDSTFVEGRNGSEYMIRIRNNTYNRVCFVVSVDGLSVLDGKDCSDSSPGYILNSRDSLDIACYKVDDATGARFVFGTKEKSYSSEIGKGIDNTGVIAMKVYQEQYVAPYVHHHYCFPPAYPTSCSKKTYGSSGYGMSGYRGITKSASSTGWGLDQLGSSSVETLSAQATCQSTNTASASLGSHTNQSVADMPLADDIGLGTKFGEAMAWETQTVNFRRNAHPAAQMVIYYDNKKGLERRGVRLEKKAPPLPNPFPGNENGCATPPGWRK